MKRIAIFMLCCLTAPVWAENSLKVEGAWLRATPPGQSMAAAYMELINTGSKAVTLLGVATDAAAHAEIHRNTISEGMNQMRPSGPVSVAAGGTYSLKPGGSHLMLMGMKSTLTEGDTIAIELLLGDGTKLGLTLPVHRSAPGRHK